MRDEAENIQQTIRDLLARVGLPTRIDTDVDEPGMENQPML